MDKVDTIVFDYGGVVADQYCEPYQTRIAVTLGVTYKEARQLLSEASEQGRAYRLGEMDADEFWHAIETICQKQIDQNILQNLWDQTYMVNSAMMSIIHYLKYEVGVQIGVVSNDIRPRWEHIVQTQDIFQTADHQFPETIAVVSYEVGVLKPDPAFFREILVSCRRKDQAKRVLYIDDRAMHVQRALKEGMQAELFVNAGEFASLVAEYMDERRLIRFVP